MPSVTHILELATTGGFHSSLARKNIMLAYQVLFVLLAVCFRHAVASGSAPSVRRPTIAFDASQHVPVDLFVMSKCPDAVACEKTLAPVLRNLRELVTIETHYIANRYSHLPYSCMHGPSECAGNRYQLCAHEWVSRSGSHADNFDLFYRFLLCQDRNLTAVGEAESAHDCLLGSGFLEAAAQEVMICANSKKGEALMHRSMDYSHKHNASVSCTVRIGTSECVHDGGRWRDGCPGAGSPLGFRDLICDAYESMTGAPPPHICSDEALKQSRRSASAAHRRMNVKRMREAPGS